VSNLIPVAMSKEQLVNLLEDITRRVQAGDSYEGNLQYEMPIEDGQADVVPGWPTADCDFWVTGTYRIGNLQGQGGMRMIGEAPVL